MMFEISFVSQIEELEREMPAWAVERIPSITRNALNDVADDARFAERQKMRGVFDRPTPFIERSVKVLRATKGNLVATVYIEDDGRRPPTKILAAEVFGGARQPKAFELALRRIGVMRGDEYAVVAIGQRRDAYGNLPGSTIVQMLSQLRTFTQAGFSANETERSKKRKGRGAARYFVPGGYRFEKGIGRLPRGVYVREGKRIRAVVIFVSGAPRYERRYDFGQATKATVERHFWSYWERYFYAELAKRT